MTGFSFIFFLSDNLSVKDYIPKNLLLCVKFASLEGLEEDRQQAPRNRDFAAINRK